MDTPFQLSTSAQEELPQILGSAWQPALRKAIEIRIHVFLTKARAQKTFEPSAEAVKVIKRLSRQYDKLWQEFSALDSETRSFLLEQVGRFASYDLRLHAIRLAGLAEGKRGRLSKNQRLFLAGDLAVVFRDHDVKPTKTVNGKFPRALRLLLPAAGFSLGDDFRKTVLYPAVDWAREEPRWRELFFEVVYKAPLPQDCRIDAATGIPEMQLLMEFAKVMPEETIALLARRSAKKPQQIR